MGYSCRMEASETIQSFRGDDGSQNVWSHKGNKYFWERGRENDDGAVTGTIYRYIDDQYVVKCGSFRVDPDGHIARAPFGMKDKLTEYKPPLTYRQSVMANAYRPKGGRECLS